MVNLREDHNKHQFNFNIIRCFMVMRCTLSYGAPFYLCRNGKYGKQKTKTKKKTKIWAIIQCSFYVYYVTSRMFKSHRPERKREKKTEISFVLSIRYLIFLLFFFFFVPSLSSFDFPFYPSLFSFLSVLFRLFLTLSTHSPPPLPSLAFCLFLCSAISEYKAHTMLST